MLKSMFVTAGMAAVLLVASIYYGCRSYIQAYRNRLARQVKESMSADLQLERARVLLGEVDGAVEEAARDVARNDVAIARVEKILEQRNEEIEKSKRILAHLGELLRSNRSTYMISDREVGRDELRDEIRARWSLQKRMESGRKRLRGSLAELRRRRVLLNRGLVDVKAKRSALAQRIEILETELVAVRAAERSGEINSSLVTSSAVAELAEALDEVEVAIRSRRMAAGGGEDLIESISEEADGELPEDLRQYLSEERSDEESDQYRAGVKS